MRTREAGHWVQQKEFGFWSQKGEFKFMVFYLEAQEPWAGHLTSLSLLLSNRADNPFLRARGRNL